ncbi:adrenodoxin-like [Uloborus diversus]|uniref:adrenodoxin-like n=1 Tax=Uloborus diversus TaxID=327109 RepID=UPI00240A8896|nr:adrenodoxin-like [Uloborus diversus]
MLKSSQVIKNLVAVNKNVTSKLLQSKLKCKCFAHSCYNSYRFISTSFTLMKKARVPITFVKVDGTQLTGIGKEGESLLDVIVNNELDLSGYGACEGTLSCSTCHVIFKEEDFQKLKDEHQIATDEELDMLDLAPGACSTSRLGCQITVTKDMSGLTVTVPEIVKDQRELPFVSETEKQSGQ